MPEMDRTPVGVLKQAALGQARLTHEATACDDYDPDAGRDAGGHNRVWCQSCGRSLLVWGDTTPQGGGE